MPDLGYGGMPGVTTTKKKGKNDTAAGIPQIDIQQAYGYFDNAARTQAEYYQRGLDQYSNMISQAREEINKGYQEAKDILKPVSYASTQALNEQLRFMGIDPMPATQGIAEQLKSLESSDPQFAALAKQMESANKIKDTAQRETVKQDILSQANQLTGTIPELQAQINQLQGFQKPWFQTHSVSHYDGLRDYYEVLSGDWGGIDVENLVKQGGGKRGSGNPLLVQAAQQKQQEVANQLQEAQTRLQERQLLQELTPQFQEQYRPEYDAGYTGEQVAEKITSTPGYEFQFSQGQKALERSAAARGMLSSGNTGTALTYFGQELGQTYFNQHMTNLANIAAQGMWATGQLANNAVTQGQNQAALSEALGGAQMNTQGLIGQAYGQAWTNKANAFIDAAKFNTGMQFQDYQRVMGSQTAMAQQAMASAPAMANAGTARSMFNYSVFQNQQAAQAAQNARSGGSVPTNINNPDVVI